MAPRGSPTYECIYEVCKHRTFRSKGSCEKHLLNKHITPRELRCIRCNDRFPTVPKAKKHCKKCSKDEMAYLEDKPELDLYTTEHLGACFSTPHKLAKEILELCKMDGRRRSRVTHDALPVSHDASGFFGTVEAAPRSTQVSGLRASSTQEPAIETKQAETLRLSPTSSEAVMLSRSTCPIARTKDNSQWSGCLPQHVASRTAGYPNTHLQSNYVNAVQFENSAEGVDHDTQQSSPWESTCAIITGEQPQSFLHPPQVIPPHYYFSGRSSGSYEID